MLNALKEAMFWLTTPIIFCNSPRCHWHNSLQRIFLADSNLWPPNHLNPFAPGDFAEKRVLKLVEWFCGHCRAIKS